MATIKKLFILIMVLVIPLLAQEYAFAYIEGGSGSNTVGTSWVNIGAGGAQDLTLAQNSSNWSLNSNTLLASSNSAVAGNYCIKYSLSFNADAADWFIGISIDGAAPEEPVFIRSISNTRKDAGNVSGIYMASISQGQTVELVVKSDGNNNDFTPIYAQLVICPAAMKTLNHFGGMHISTSANLSNIGTSITKITNFAAVPEMNGWTSSGGELTAGSGTNGLYYLSYSVSFTGDGNETSPIEYIFEVLKNNTEGSSHILTNRSTSSLDIGNVSAGGLINISDGDVISLGVKAHLNNNPLSIHKATISMFKLGDTTPNSVGGMTITSSQSITVPSQDTWVTVGNYSLKSANNWSLSSNIFTPTSTDAVGYYYLEYTTSLSTSNSGGDDIELAAFIDGTQGSEFTTARRLSSSSDIGAVCGVGLLEISDESQTITIKIRNTTSDSDLSISKSMVGFSQIQTGVAQYASAISLSSFVADIKDGCVELKWVAESQNNNAKFLLYRNDDLIAKVDGEGTCCETKCYCFLDKTIIPGNTYTYTLADLDYSNKLTKHDEFSKTVEITTNIIETGFKINSIYPNPFNPSTCCELYFPEDTYAHVVIYNSKGRPVSELYNGSVVAGIHNMTWNAIGMPSGIYFIVAHADGMSDIHKIALLK